MGTDRSDKVYEWWLDATFKFDYFVAGVALALLGYLATSIKIGPLGVNPITLEIIAVIAILGAVIAALKRIEAMLVALKLMHTVHQGGESAGKLTAAAAKGGQLLNERTGEVFDPAIAMHRAMLATTTANSAKQSFDTWARRARRRYSWRNRLLIGGLTLIIASRVWAALVAASHS